MSQNPYAPPQAPSIGPAEPAPRKRWIAVLLALIVPPIGMLYVVRPFRALVYLGIGVLLFLAVFALGLKAIVDPNLVTLVGAVAWRLAAVIDVYRLAPLWREASLPWYSRPKAMVGFVAAAWVGISSVRAFVTEPFRIPTSSMSPTLQVGDHILVDKRTYGWDLPLTERRFFRAAHPRRGDVAVFRFPQDRNLSYVMRVIALPGEKLAYADKRLAINDRPVPLSEDGSEVVRGDRLLRYQERLDELTHPIFLDPAAPSFAKEAVREFPAQDACRYQSTGVTCTVPTGHYFVMGDNRDNAFDSRFWGFVPEDDFLGRVLLIWYSRDPARSGARVQ